MNKIFSVFAMILTTTLGMSSCSLSEISSFTNRPSTEPTVETSSSGTSEASSSTSSETETSSMSTSSTTTSSSGTETTSSPPYIPLTNNVVIREVIARSENAIIEWDALAVGYTYNVYFKSEHDLNYNKLDDELIKDNKAYFLGLKQNTTYEFKVVPLNNDIEFPTYASTKTALIGAYDRSGYAFFNTVTKNKIGAYNEDGTLKDNAKVIYVNNENKNTVTFTHNSKTYTGLGNILANIKSINIPLNIRISGRISTAQYNVKVFEPIPITEDLQNTKYDSCFINTFESNDILKGLTNKITRDSKATTTYTNNNKSIEVYDTDSYFNMMDIKESSSGLTIEGIDEDAELYQWGMTFSKCNNLEVRNLTFTNNPEDACSIDGDNSKPGTYSGFWIHNNTFNAGKNNWDITGEQDKYAGDGATDLKGISNVTMSYNLYNQCKKTGLVGGSNSNLQKNITFHHNYFKDCQSRLPLARQANLHYYNNYFYGTTGSCMSLRANTYALSEANYFENSKNVILSVSDSTYGAGVCKSYNDFFQNCSGTNDAIKVSSRSQIVKNTCTFGQNFDTDSSLFYYDTVNNITKVSYLTMANVAKEDCKLYSGATGINKIN